MQLKVFAVSAILYFCASFVKAQIAQPSVSVSVTTTTVTVTAAYDRSTISDPIDADEETTSFRPTSGKRDDNNAMTMFKEEELPLQMQVISTPWLVTPATPTAMAKISSTSSKSTSSGSGPTFYIWNMAPESASNTMSYSHFGRAAASHNFSKNPPSPSVMKKSVKNGAAKVGSASALWGFVLMAVFGFQ